MALGVPLFVVVFGHAWCSVVWRHAEDGEAGVAERFREIGVELLRQQRHRDIETNAIVLPPMPTCSVPPGVGSSPLNSEREAVAE